MFTGGGIDALAPNSDGDGGYAALSALPVFFGQKATAPFGPGVFTGGGIPALSNYDALSAIPAYLISRPPAATAGAQNIAPAQARLVEQSAPASTPPTGSNPVQKFVASLPKAFTPPAPQVFTPPAPPKEEPKVEAAATPGDNGGPKLNVSRLSEKFTPKGIGDNPLLFGGGTPGVDNGIRGWGSALKSIGLGGGEDGGQGAGTP